MLLPQTKAKTKQRNRRNLLEVIDMLISLVVVMVLRDRHRPKLIKCAVLSLSYISVKLTEIFLHFLQ